MDDTPVQVNEASLLEIRHIPVDGHHRDGGHPGQVLDTDASLRYDVLGYHLPPALGALRCGRL